MSNEKVECTFLWCIENYSYCWHKCGEKLVSPEFTPKGFDGTVWKLWLYPRCDRQEKEGYVSLFLTRSNSDNGPDDCFIEYELSILAESGLPIRSGLEYIFGRGGGFGRSDIIKMDEILSLRKDDFLPRDTLSVCCKMWKGEGNVKEMNDITARTRIGIEEISFLHFTDSFSKMKPNEKKTIKIKYLPKKCGNLKSSLHFIENSNGGKIFVEITPSGKNQILAKCKISLLDVSGRKIDCAEADCRFDPKREDIANLSLSFSRFAILNQKSDYLPKDNLSLLLECVFSTGVEYEEIERTLFEKNSNKRKNVQSKDINSPAKKLSVCPNVVNDLKEIYNNQVLTDVELKTKTKSFPAHKICLCARSPVFKAMLTSDMREKNSNIIPVEDLEDETVQQFLLFLYSDKLENLSWESAIKLYYTGDKYQIERLKLICSSFLLDKVSTTSASELLTLADTHSDSDLKEAVEDFILKHEKNVFSSEEWKKLSEENPQLANKTMLMKYERKSAGDEDSQ